MTDESLPTQCSKCLTPNRRDAKFCGRCGERLVEATIACPACGIAVRAIARFCGNCGSPMNVADGENSGQRAAGADLGSPRPIISASAASPFPTAQPMSASPSAVATETIRIISAATDATARFMGMILAGFVDLSRRTFATAGMSKQQRDKIQTAWICSIILALAVLIALAIILLPSGSRT